MKDSDARGIVLRRMYDLRDQKRSLEPKDFVDLSVSQDSLPRILEQLAEQKLIRWHPVRGGMGIYLAFMASITSHGSNVIEGEVQSPIAITLDQSINVHGSHNVQVGGEGNVQNITMDIDKMVSIVDSANASVTEKEEAKSLLKKISENKLVQLALKTWMKRQTGS